MTPFVLSQIFAALTFVLALVAYQCKNQKVVLSLLTLAQVFSSIHFLLLGSLVGAVIFSLSALRFFTGIWTKHSLLKYFFLITTLVVGVSIFQNAIDILPILGGLLGTLAAFTPMDKRMRLFLIGGTVTTLLFNIALFSPVAIASGLFFLFSGLIGYWRFYIKNST
jgi:hypothetical protein